MKSENHAWIKEFPAAITVSDAEGVLLEMNDASADHLAKDGGRKLIGKNMLDCHPDPARGKVERLLEKKQANIYTIEKGGIKKLIYQSPWYIKGKFAGFVELSMEIPFELPHFVRD